MEPKFVNEFNLTYEMYTEWAKHPIAPKAVKVRRKRTCLLSIGVLCSVFITIEAILLCDFFVLTTGLVLLMLVLNQLFLLPIRVRKKQYELSLKTYYNDNQCVIKTVFSDQILIIQGNTTMKIACSEIQRMQEDGAYFYLITDRELVMRIRKDGFVVGNADEFRTFWNQMLCAQNAPQGRNA